MTENKKTARLAGLIYLFMGITTPLGIMIIPSKLIIEGNPAATAGNLIASSMLVRVGIVSTIIGQILFLALVVFLYKLFKDVNRIYAVFMAACVVAAVPVTIMLAISQMGALSAAAGRDYFNMAEPAMRNAIMMLCQFLFDKGIIMVGIFWGLWLFPFGMLVYKSGFIPKIFGILLLINCAAYILDSLLFVLVPPVRTAITQFLMVPMMIGELPIIAWFLIKGVSTQSRHTLAN